MGTNSRIRRNMDYGRMREAIKGPGVDTRVWVNNARVDDDADAIRWEDGIGWIVDVTFLGGPLDQEGPVPCRVASSFANAQATRSEPIPRGCEVQVLVNEGDPNVGCVIVGFTHNEDDCVPPTSVNGEDITEELALANHILVTPHGVLEQIAGALKQVVDAERHVESTGKHKVLGATVDLAEDGAGQSFIRGEDFTNALTTWLAALDVWITATNAAILAGAASGSAKAAHTAATAAYTVSSTAFNQLIPPSLSSRIKGE